MVETHLNPDRRKWELSKSLNVNYGFQEISLQPMSLNKSPIFLYYSCLNFLSQCYIFCIQVKKSILGVIEMIFTPSIIITRNQEIFGQKLADYAVDC